MIEPLSVGTRVEKINSVPGKDGHADGARATVVKIAGRMPQDLKDPELRGHWTYFVLWDDFPGIPVFVAGHRIREVTG